MYAYTMQGYTHVPDISHSNYCPFRGCSQNCGVHATGKVFQTRLLLLSP